MLSDSQISCFHQNGHYLKQHTKTCLPAFGQNPDSATLQF